MQCTLCQKELLNKISNKDSKNAEKISVFLCHHCGLIQQNPIPSNEELKIYYSHNYRKDYKNTYAPKTKHIFRAAKTALGRIEFLKNANIDQGTLLDVGAGGGEFVYLARKAGFESKGIEPNIGYSEFATQTYGCDIATGELGDVSGSYDIITMFHVLEHLPSPLKVFEKLYSLLNKNGTLFIEVPWIETADASPHNIYFKAHIFYFNADTLIACASQYFDVVSVDTSSNLKILFKAKSHIAPLQLPDTQSVNRLKKRVAQKGWIEYLFKGRGILKPFAKIAQSFNESKVRDMQPKEILDTFSV